MKKSNVSTGPKVNRKVPLCPRKYYGSVKSLICQKSLKVSKPRPMRI